MNNQIFGVLVISFAILAIISLFFSKSFRKSVAHHIVDWMAKKVSRALIFIIAIIIIAFGLWLVNH